MISVFSGVETGSVNVMTSEEGGLNTEQIVELAMDKIMKVSDTAPPAIRDQAEAFQNTWNWQGVKNVLVLPIR